MLRCITSRHSRRHCLLRPQSVERWSLALPLALLLTSTASAQTPTTACGQQSRVALQVLGSGGPELTDGRASSGYLLWVDGRSAVLIDAGPGTALHFEASGARLEDLDAILMTHLHVDHSAGLAAWIKGGYFTARKRPLPVYGPAGNDFLPPTDTFVRRLIGNEGVYPYLADLQPGGGGAFEVAGHVIDPAVDTVITLSLSKTVTVAAVATHHGPIPALAWRLAVGDTAIVISGDTTNQGHTVNSLDDGDIDLLIAHNAIPESATGAASGLHMRPTDIAALAKAMEPDILLLSHFMRRSWDEVVDTQRRIAAEFAGRIELATDLGCLKLE